MARYIRFVFLVNKDERRKIAELARRLQRKEADAVRFAALEYARALDADTPATTTAQPTGGQHGNG